ncbi:MAG: hypothetical protein MPEBLZ_00117 [Candidatus Methanoperedens nitroreducens]|uniref:DUF5402 family protein n=1 Tax=Candidatus Methanoperedens nitratireducens TaxID=1392998 RepID=A0A0P7ZLY5_9EURY|nr:MAG: hypothetical protein MPEBLZ_00117 [Candidatus Methanoperedens sp. BLZ1]
MSAVGYDSGENMILEEILKNRAGFEEKLRKLIGRPVLLIELDMFALPCGCSGITANMRGLEFDDLEVFEPQILPLVKEMAEKLGVKPTVTFARLVPGSSIVASLNWRTLCPRCYPEFARGAGKMPRPDLYMLLFERRK